MTDPREEISNLLKALWPHFLEWVADYVGSPGEAREASYSREDMRYAYKAGYEKAIDYVEMVSRPMKGDEVSRRLSGIGTPHLEKLYVDGEKQHISGAGPPLHTQKEIAALWDKHTQRRTKK